MRVCGFTIVRNAIKYDYPVVESILSVLPLCDEFIVLLGDSEDSTRQLIKELGEAKIRIIDSKWDDSLREGGKVLAQETNKAFDLIDASFDWAFYIQADELIHEKYHAEIRKQMFAYKDEKQVEGLLFNYTHFYGSYDYVANSRRWYRKEIRVIKNDKQIRSYRDAQGFRKNEKKLKVKAIDASVYHYGWVKPPELQQAKQENFHKMWHKDEWLQENIVKAEAFDYSQIDSLLNFSGSHPACMQQRIARKNWKFDFKPHKKASFKIRVLQAIENISGWRIGEYKNYKLI